MTTTTNIFTPFRIKSSLAARSANTDLQTTVTNYEQLANETYNIPIVYSTTNNYGRPSLYETISTSTSMSPLGISAIDSASAALQLTLPPAVNNGTQKEFFLIYNRSNTVVITYNTSQTITLYGNQAYYKLLFINGAWINLSNQY